MQYSEGLIDTLKILPYKHVWFNDEGEHSFAPKKGYETKVSREEILGTEPNTNGTEPNTESKPATSRRSRR